MTAGAPHREVKAVIRELIDARGSIANRDVVEALDDVLSRQAVHQHLAAMVEDGELERVGAGRAVRYRRAVLERRTLPTDGLAEDQLWADLAADVDALASLPEDVTATVAYIVTEMVNNVIDHSGSDTVTVTVRTDDPYLVIDIADRGVGIFAKVAAALGSDDPMDAVVRLSSGRFTTAPDRHTGEGIFFSSRAAHQFIVVANGVRWTVDNERDDWGAGRAEPRDGTLVRFRLDPARARSLAEVFAPHTDDDYQFTKTSTRVALAGVGVHLISRSEAKRIATGLDQFDHVVVDFAGVSDVGQGFADELFRVWSDAHPDVTLEPVNMDRPVAFMIERARTRAADSDPAAPASSPSAAAPASGPASQSAVT